MTDTLIKIEANFVRGDIYPFRLFPLRVLSEFQTPSPTFTVPRYISHDASAAICFGIAAKPKKGTFGKGILHKVLQIRATGLPFMHGLPFLDSAVVVLRGI